jgi:nitroreductase
MSLLNAASAFGYDAQWLTEWYAFDETLKTHFGVKEHERIAGFFHFGTATMPKTERERPELDAIISFLE